VPFLRSKPRTGMPIAWISAFSCSFDGGALRYSMTVGSMPAWRSNASVLRDVPHDGL
jgi:hypothetical protein